MEIFDRELTVMVFPKHLLRDAIVNRPAQSQCIGFRLLK
jgi:hypothetical protein